MPDRDRSIEDLTRSLDALRVEVGRASTTQRRSSKETKEETSKLRQQLVGAAKGSLAAVGGSMLYGASQGLRNPYLSAWGGAQDVVWQGLAQVGVASQEAQAIGLAGQRVGGLAQTLARGGREIPTQRLRELMQFRAGQARKEVEAQHRVEGIAAEMRREAGDRAVGISEPISDALAPVLTKFTQAVDRLGSMIDKIPFFRGGGR